MKQTILDLYRTTQETMGNTAEYSNMLKDYDVLRRRLTADFNTKQNDVLEELEDLKNDMTEEKNRQCFETGFTIATRLITETFYNGKTHIIC